MTEQPSLFDNVVPEPPWTCPGLDRLRERAREPVKKCSCCGGRTKIYRRKLNSGMARVLVELYHRRGDWVHLARAIPNIVATTHSDHAKLEHWGLVTSKPSPNTECKRDSGFWRITDEGCEFTTRRSRLPSHIFVAPGNVLLGFEDTTVDIVDALGKHFDYYELMRGE